MLRRVVGVAAFLCTTSGLAQSLPRAAVMPLKAKRVPAEITAVLDDLLLVTLAETEKLAVIGPQEIEALLAQEQLKDTLGCDNVSCAAEIGGALDARYVVSGSVGRLGDNVVISLTLFDTSAMQASRRAKVTTTNDENVFEVAIRDAVAQLLSLASATQSETAPAEPHHEPALSPSEPEPTGPGALVIDSSPQGARVTIAGREIGLTPLTVTDLQAGIVTVDFDREHHDSQRVYATVHPGRESHVRATLPAWGTLRLFGTEQASVWIDGEQRGQLPFDVPLAPGRHPVSVRLLDHVTWNDDVAVETGQRVEREVHLTSHSAISSERAIGIVWGSLSLVAGLGFGGAAVFGGIRAEAVASDPDRKRLWESVSYAAATLSLICLVFSYTSFSTLPTIPDDGAAIALRIAATPSSLALALDY